MYQTCYWVQRIRSESKTAYRIVDDEFEEIITDDNNDMQYGHDNFYSRTITKGIIDAYSKRGASKAKIAKCLFLAFKGHERGSSGNHTIADMITISRSVEPRFKDYEEQLKMLLLFS